MQLIYVLFLTLGIPFFCFAGSVIEISPYKYTDEERMNGGPVYEIPVSSRLVAQKKRDDYSEIVYYLSRPQVSSFSIAILVGGSSLEDDICSIIHFHRYFLKEFLDMGVGVVTIEQQGIDGNRINTKEFMKNYTRSNRLSDHRVVIESLKNNPPVGWNGKLIFLGVSEGGPIVTTLTCDYSAMTIATINWSGAGDFSWRDELWHFMQDMIAHVPWIIRLRAMLPSWMPYSLDLYFPKSHNDYDNAMDETIKNPSVDLKLAGMTYKYHADALAVYPKVEYEKIKTPYLVVVGSNDSIIESVDAFVCKAKGVNAPVTYMRIDSMDHYVRKREDVIEDSFVWLKNQLSNIDTYIDQFETT